MPAFFYIGDPRKFDTSNPNAGRRYTDQPAIRMFGYDFTYEAPTVIPDEDERTIGKLRGNSHFKEAVEHVEVAPEPETDERDDLIAQGAELGLSLNKRMSAETMRERIQEAMNGGPDAG